jgi:hypothetical protein
MNYKLVNHKLSSKLMVKCEPIEELTIDLPEIFLEEL